MKVLEPPLDVISRDARAYPVHLLREGDTALCLFAAAFLGINDAIHFARNEMTGTCVDRDGERLGQMAERYPEHWAFVTEDAWEFAARAESFGEMWDVVSVDTFTGDATDRSMETLDLWCSLSRRVVTATIATGQECLIPDGWTADLYPRSQIADWLVLTCV